MSDMEEFFGPPIHTYGRNDALRDGELVNVTEIATQFGHRWPVAITRALHEWLWERSVAHLEAQQGWQVAVKIAPTDKLEEMRRIAYNAAVQGLMQWSIHEIHAAGNDPRRSGDNLITGQSWGNDWLPMREIYVALTGDDAGKPCWTLMFPEDY